MEALGEYEDEADDASDDEPGAAEPADAASFSTLPEHLLEKIFGHLRGSNRKHHFAMWVLHVAGPALGGRGEGSGSRRPLACGAAAAGHTHTHASCWHNSCLHPAKVSSPYPTLRSRYPPALNAPINQCPCCSVPVCCSCGVNRQWRRLGQAMFFSRPWEVAHLICHPTQLFCLVRALRRVSGPGATPMPFVRGLERAMDVGGDERCWMLGFQLGSNPAPPATATAPPLPPSAWPGPPSPACLVACRARAMSQARAPACSSALCGGKTGPAGGASPSTLERTRRSRSAPASSWPPST